MNHRPELFRLSLGLALVVWVALVPVINLLSVPAEGSPWFGVQTGRSCASTGSAASACAADAASCARPAEIVASGSCGDPAAAVADAGSGCSAARAVCGESAPVSDEATSTGHAVDGLPCQASEDVRPIVVKCCLCICLGDLTMLAGPTFLGEVGFPCLGAHIDAPEHFASRTPRPSTPPPQLG